MKRWQARELAGTNALKPNERKNVAAAVMMMTPGPSEAVRELTERLTSKQRIKDMAELKDICGAWKRQPKNGGRAYYSGKVEREIVIPAGSYLNVFQNPDANEENKKPQLKIAFSEPS